VTNNICN